MAFKPLINFRGTTIARAFLINAFLIGITTALTIEVRRIIQHHKYTKELPDRPHKVMATAFASVIFALTAYIIARFILGSGGGMLAMKTRYPSFF
jgi:hypothetical protein